MGVDPTHRPWHAENSGAREIACGNIGLGKTGPNVSRICLGMLTFGPPSWRDYMLTEAEGRPIVGVTTLLHLEEAIASLEIKLPPSVIADLEELYYPKQVLGLWP